MKKYMLFLRSLSFLCAFAVILLLSRGMANAAELVDPFDFSQDGWVVFGGYGQSVPGWGETEERVKTLELIPRYSHRIIAEMGSGWYRGFHSILLEVPLSLVLSPDESAMLAINFLGAYTFTADSIWQPYLFGGGGPVYNFADISGMGADLNGNYQFGIGLACLNLGPQGRRIIPFREGGPCNVQEINSNALSAFGLGRRVDILWCLAQRL